MRNYLVFLLLFVAQYALAQIQVLPDMEITGESQTKIFLYKKALPYSPASSLADSLSPYLPLELPPMKHTLPSPSKPVLKHYFAANGRSGEKADLHYRYYHQGGKLQSLGLEAEYEKPAAEYQMKSFESVGDVDWSKYLQLRARTTYRQNETPKLSNEIKGVQIASFSEPFALGSSGLSELTNLLKYIEYKQEDRGLDTRIKSLFWQHQHQIELGKYSLQNSICLSGDNTVFMTHLKSPDYFFEQSGIFLLYNIKHLIPGFSFHSSYNLDFNKSLNVGNYPKVITQDYDSILQEYPYIDATDKMRHSLVPLNLQVVYEQEHPEYNILGFTGMKLSDTAQYFCDQPKLVKQESKLVALGFQDALENSTALGLNFEKGAFTWEQSFALSLAWLNQKSTGNKKIAGFANCGKENKALQSKQNWQIKPYFAPVVIQSDVGYTLAKWQADLSFIQELGAFIPANESNNGKKEYFSMSDLDLSLAYQVAAEGQVYLKGLNLLNVPHIIHKELPTAGRELQLGLRLWF